MAYVFYKFHICFFLICAQTNQTHRTYVWRHKAVKAQREDYVATCLTRMYCKNHTHEHKSSETHPNGCNW